ncbi:MAG: heparinase II/III family protein [Chthoniobacteraceae bacterium]|nr:heparinase II/III family protein [Chthoniobacteraceae bacterium]
MSPDLFDSGWNAARIEEVLSRHPRRPLLPPCESPEWRRVAANPVAARLIGPLRARAEAECTEPLPALTDALYASFRHTGIRLTFERVYFERRRRLARAAVSLLLSSPEDPWRARLQASMLEKFRAIFEEVSWALPAHVNWDNEDACGKEPLQIDLFCAETANLMAEMLDLFGSVIPADLQARVRERLQTAVFENYLRRPFHWKVSTNNWNAVCHQGVIGAALATVDDPHFLAELLAEARKRLPAFLSGFGPDGGCSEGPGYWNYGFGWFAVLNEQLETRTEGELSLFGVSEKIRAMAQYGPRVCLRGGNLVNFADCGATGGLRPPLVAYLAKRLDDADCRYATFEAYRSLAAGAIDPDSERSDLFQLARLLLFCPEDLSAPATAAPADCYLPDLAVVVSHGTDRRGHTWDFAAKAGHNAEHHNHNDCGSYILNIDGVRLITEIGSPEYVRDFFSPKRYEFLAARTLGHSLPIINGCEQPEGSQYASKVLSHALEADHTAFRLDGTACYPAEAGCKRFVRAFRFEKEAGKLTVEETFELERTVSLETAVITCQPATQKENLAVIEAGGLALAIRPAPGTRLDRIEQHTYQNHDGVAESIQRLVFTPETLSAQVRLAIEIELL